MVNSFQKSCSAVMYATSLALLSQLKLQDILLPDFRVFTCWKKGGGDEVALFWRAPAKASTGQQQGLDTKIDEIINEFRNYVDSTNSLFAAAYDDPKLEELLFDFLVSREKRVSAAAAILYGVKDTSQNGYRSEEEFVCARFLEELERSRPELFALLGDISNAAVLSEVVLELSDGRPTKNRKVDDDCIHPMLQSQWTRLVYRGKQPRSTRGQ